jgi:gamma-glutamylputrescine oxidase
VLVELADAGAKAIRHRVEKYGIDAHLHRGYGYLGVNARQARTLRKMADEFRAMDPAEDIEYYEAAEVRDIIGSDAYCAAVKHMGGGHVHSLNLLLGEAKAAQSLGVQIYENSPVLDVEYGDAIVVRTNSGTVRAKKLLWACDSFLRKLEPEIHGSTIHTYSFQVATEPLSEEMCLRISPFRGAYSDISSVINYYRVTAENRLLFGSATRFVEYMPKDFEAWNRSLLREVFPYLADVKIDYAWGGPMACSANLFPQVGTLKGRPNVFYAQGYSGFGVTPSHIVCQVLADGMSGGSERFEVMRAIPKAQIPGKDFLRPAIMSAAKSLHYVRCLVEGR